jgi:hypothetical protein
VAGSMIAKTFFLAKVIHRILIRSLRGKKSLHENLAKYRTFFRFGVGGRLAEQAEDGGADAGLGGGERDAGSGSQRQPGVADRGMAGRFEGVDCGDGRFPVGYRLVGGLGVTLAPGIQAHQVTGTDIEQVIAHRDPGPSPHSVPVYSRSSDASGARSDDMADTFPRVGGLLRGHRLKRFNDRPALQIVPVVLSPQVGGLNGQQPANRTAQWNCWVIFRGVAAPSPASRSAQTVGTW